MQCWQRRAGHGSLSCASLSVSHAQQPCLNLLPYAKIRCGVHSSPQRQRWLGPCSSVDPSSKPNAGTATQAHRSAVSLHQRAQSSTDHSSHGHGQHHRQLKDDGSLKIIMLLSLSLTLLLLPWVCHHPEFLVVPVLLAFTPVVGNGVRPVLKEIAAGFIATLRLMGIAAWYDVTHELPNGQHSSHHHHHNGHIPGGSSSNNGYSGSSAGLQQPYGRESPLYQQQQWQQQQQQPPAPSGPYSTWPNPAYMPPDWSPAAAAAAAAGLQQQQPVSQAAAGPPAAAVAAAATAGLVSHPLPHPAQDDVADVDWTPSAPPDPHRVDPVSLQHLRQVLEADLVTEAELEQQQAGAAAMAAGSSGSGNAGRVSPGRNRSPAGSPGMGNSPAASIDAAEFGQQQQQVPLAQAPTATSNAASHLLDQQQQQQPHSRDPRVLSKEAKQQLYQNHHSHLHGQHNSSSNGIGGSSN